MPCTSIDEASRRIDETGFAYLDIEYLCPKLHQIIEMRPILGLRSPVHTIARMLNPFNAPYMMQGIFHPGYRPMHQEAAMIMGQPHMAVIKGEGGEIERNPDQPCLVQSVHNGEMSEEEWPALFSQRHVKDDELNIQRLRDLWEGRDSDEYGIASVTGTTAIALKMMAKAPDMKSAEQQARDLWEARSKQNFGAAA
jgi:anthranilate phosphoribosyltransferase